MGTDFTNDVFGMMFQNVNVQQEIANRAAMLKYASASSV